jgi:invasion protein IalB
MIRNSSLSRFTPVVLGAVLLAASGTASFAAHKKPVSTDTAAPAGGGKPELLGTYGDWSAYLSQNGKSKVCYALASPKDRQPNAMKRDSAYIFIADRPAEHVKNEISIIMGLPLKEGADGAEADLGSRSFDLIAKGSNAWIKNAAEEGQFIDAMKRGGKLVIKVPALKGGTEVDTYGISGLRQALDRVQKECS